MPLLAPVEPPPTQSPCRDGAATSEWLKWITADFRQSESTATKRRALLISYLYPPTGGSGIYRPAGLARCLPACGWEVETLTAAHDRFAWHDSTLMDLLPENGIIHRVSGFEPACLARRLSGMLGFNNHWRRWAEDRFYWRMIKITGGLRLGNGDSLWCGAARRAAIGRHLVRPFDAVISTGPPHFTHRVAMRFAKATGVPWIADLRDPLLSDFDRGDSHRDLAAQTLEHEILNRADAVVTTSPALADDLRARYSDRAGSEIVCVTNGFDRETVRSVAYLAGRNSRTCHFVCAGSFYGRREVRNLIEPLADVLNRRPEWRGRVRLTVAGLLDREQETFWRVNRPEWAIFTGYIDHRAALRLSIEASCNVIVVPECRHGRQSIPGKTFELLALPRHVLALAPMGSDTEQLVSQAGAATHAPFENASRVASAYEKIIENCLSGELPAGRDWRAIDVYDRSMIARRFSDVLALVALRRPKSISPSLSGELRLAGAP